MDVNKGHGRDIPKKSKRIYWDEKEWHHNELEWDWNEMEQNGMEEFILLLFYMYVIPVHCSVNLVHPLLLK